jgi:AraC-like DNA-binding protein
MPETVDIVFRTVAIMAAVLLAGLFIAARRSRPAAVPGALLSLAAVAFFVTSTEGGSDALGAWRYPLTALCVTKAAWFWLFARALFIDGAKIGARHLAVVGTVAIAGTWQQLSFLPAFRAGTASTWESVVGFGFEGVLAALVLLGIYEAWRGMATDLVEDRRRQRVGFMAATGLYLAATLAVQSHNLLLGVSTAAYLSLANMAVVAVACLVAAWFLLQLRRETWLDTGRPVKVVALSRVEASLLKRLERALETDRIFVQEGLTIGALAEHLGTGEHVLRAVINQGMGFRNFNDFLHAWRIREACEKLARPEHAREPVLAIAMEVGYGSIGAFNRAFKERVGMTPTDYRRNSVNGTRQAPRKVA